MLFAIAAAAMSAGSVHHAADPAPGPHRAISAAAPSSAAPRRPRRAFLGDLGKIEDAQAGLVLWAQAPGAVEVLVNNAVAWGDIGPWEAPLFEDRAPASWRPVLEANVEGHYHAIQGVLPSMRARSWGRIVNVSSTVAADGLPGSGPYGAAKAALHGLTRTLAKELGPAGILVNVVMPGLTLTETNVERFSAADLEPIAAATPLRRLLRADEVAPTIVFLASAANNALTGELVRASGGAR